MNTVSPAIRATRENVRMCARLMANAHQKAFTFKTFAETTGMPLNRHLRQHLNEMASDGSLLRFETFCSDGRTRMVFCGRKTLVLPGMEV